jgi:uncharacterized membrane protein
MVAAATPIKTKLERDQLTPGSAGDTENVAEPERWLSLLGGGALAVFGLQKGSLPGLGLALVGGSMIHRGLTGHCSLYHALGISSKAHGRAAAVGAGAGIKLRHAITIQRSAEDLYRFWRDFDNLPRFMHHLVSVHSEGNRSHWVAHAPAGITVEWDAEIVNEEPNRLIAWRSLSGSQVATAGSVHFTPLAQGRSTEVTVTLKYDPPGGKLGSWLAWAFGEELQRFKQWMEANEFATADGPTARWQTSSL